MSEGRERAAGSWLGDGKPRIAVLLLLYVGAVPTSPV
jgi:hypothetical protein